MEAASKSRDTMGKARSASRLTCEEGILGQGHRVQGVKRDSN